MPGIAATLRAALADVLGGPPDVTDAQIRPWIGLPLEDTVRGLVPGVDPVAVADRYRATYAVTGVPLTHLLPGVRETFRAVRDAGGRVLIVSAKSPAGVHEVLEHVGLATGEAAPDLVVGGLFAEAKGHRLLAEGADVYVGDHPADIDRGACGRCHIRSGGDRVRIPCRSRRRWCGCGPGRSHGVPGVAARTPAR